ncbi:neprilysin-4-like [Drosophila nasuta]|uniref:neprilysin-4-like n=1 Tax=Drosophila nasuta TaxID=42062 RepID=UPI00295ECFCF|nr:neprilysin-4-like [Drosophila nasuta]
MNHSPRRILYGLTLLLLHLAHNGSAAPGKLQRDTDLISGSQRGSEYIDRVMRHAKAAEMASFMNENYDPCDDFYEFACGNWPRVNGVRANKLSTGFFERLADGLNRKVKHMLDTENKHLDTEEDQQVRNFYKSCTAITAIDESYRNKLKEVISSFGAMPALEGSKWNESEFDWIETIGQIAFTYGQTIIIGVEVATDLANNKVNMVYVSQQAFPLEVRGMYLNKHTEIYRSKYRDVMAKYLNYYLSIERKLAYSTATELMDFEVELAKGLNSENEVLDLEKESNLTTIAEMQKLYGPTLDIQRLVNISLDHKITSVYDLLPQYKINLVKVIQRTPKRILANYIFYRLLDALMLDVGATESRRKSNCRSMTHKYFAKFLDNMVYRRHNNGDTAADVELMWNEMQKTFKEKLQSNSFLKWISPQTRELAIKKMTAMKLEINSYANQDLSKEFDNIHLSEHDYIENLLHIFKDAAATSRQQINKPAKPLEDGELLSFTPANVLVENVIKVPVAVLQPYYLWASSYPNAIKFGTLAALIGHEIIHGFDISGSKFDAQGNLNDWWDEVSRNNFANRHQCFKEQYSNYSYYGKKLPESDEQSENIADNGGVRLAFDAYRRWQQAQDSSLNDPGSRLSHKETLPTLNYTSMQLFFISYAQVWCADIDPKLSIIQVDTDQHVPSKFRVLGPLSNFVEFSKEFQCALGTKMNPVRKCEIY